MHTATWHLVGRGPGGFDGAGGDFGGDEYDGVFCTEWGYYWRISLGIFDNLV